MLKSMTGFGKTTCELPDKIVSIEIRCLNSKQADIYLKLPNLYREGEAQLRNELTRSLIRGKIEFTLWYDMTGAERKANINQGVVRDYMEQLALMKEWMELPGPDILLPLAMKLPDVLSVERQEFDENEWQLVMKSITEAINMTTAFREQEGAVMETDIRARIQLIIDLAKEIDNHLESRLARIKERLEGNLVELIGKDKIDTNRFEQELIYYLEKLDITEERVRLANHCSYFIDTMDKDEFAGKKLGFIAQEIGREINTMGSKANNGDIQKLVVQMKDELEKIREQLLNVL